MIRSITKLSLLFCLVISGCGPSKEELDQLVVLREKSRAENQIDSKKIIDKYRSASEEYINKILELKGKLTHIEEPEPYMKVMEPALRSYDSLQNFTLVCFKENKVKAFDSYGLQDYGISGYPQQALKIYTNQPDSYYEIDVLEKKIASLTLKNTPYVLILEEEEETPIEITYSGYTGGGIVTYVWLADLRTMKIIAGKRIYSEPNDSLTLTEMDRKEQVIRESAKQRARSNIQKWLQSFKNADVMYL